MRDVVAAFPDPHEAESEDSFALAAIRHDSSSQLVMNNDLGYVTKVDGRSISGINDHVLDLADGICSPDTVINSMSPWRWRYPHLR